MLSVKQIHNHMAKYVSMPANWPSKYYAFEFVNSINETRLRRCAMLKMHLGTP